MPPFDKKETIRHENHLGRINDVFNTLFKTNVTEVIFLGEITRIWEMRFFHLGQPEVVWKFKFCWKKLRLPWFGNRVVKFLDYYAGLFKTDAGEQIAVYSEISICSQQIGVKFFVHRNTMQR